MIPQRLFCATNRRPSRASTLCASLFALTTLAAGLVAPNTHAGITIPAQDGTPLSPTDVFKTSGFIFYTMIPIQPIFINVLDIGAEHLVVGRDTSGEITVNAGSSLINNQSYLGYNPDTAGTVNIDGANSLWTNTDNLYVGHDGSGTLNITAGGLVTNTRGSIGKSFVASGVATVDGAGSLWANSANLFVGEFGQGVLDITNGGQVSNATSYIGKGTFATGIATVDGADSLWTNTGTLYLGNDGAGTLNILNGATVEVQSLDIHSTNGTLNWDDGTLRINGGTTTGLKNSGGTLTISSSIGKTQNLELLNGATSINGVAFIGRTTDSTGSVTVDGSGTLWQNNSALNVGNYGDGTLNITGGGEVKNTDSYIGHYGGSTGVVTLDGADSLWTSSRTLYVGNSGAGTLTINNGATVEAQTFELHATNGTLNWNDGTIRINGGTLTGLNDIDDHLLIGHIDGQNQILELTNGATVNSNEGYVGYNINAVGAVTVDGDANSVPSTWYNSGTLDVGYEGSGTLDITNGGLVRNTTGYIAHKPDSTGTITVDGENSLWNNTGTFSLGTKGVGILHVNNGGKVTSSLSYVGHNTDAVGTANIDGENSLWDNDSNLYLGNDGAGTLNITSGGQVNNLIGYVGYNANSVGIANIDGENSLWDNSGDLYLGRINSGTLNITNGGQVKNHYGYIGENANAVGAATITGENSLWDNSGNLYVGNNGNGTLDIKNGGQVKNQYGHIGEEASSNSRVTVEGAGSTWDNNQSIYIGRNGTGTLNITDGGQVNNRYSKIGYLTGSNGFTTVTGEGSTWNNSKDLTIGHYGAGKLTINNGGHVIAEIMRLTGQAVSSGTLNINGGTLEADELLLGIGAYSFNFTEGTIKLRGDQTLDADFYTTLLSTLTTGQNLEVTQTATLSNPITLDGGRFRVNQLVGAENLIYNSGTLSIATVDIAEGDTFDNAAHDATNPSLSLEIDNFNLAGTLTGSAEIQGQLNVTTTGQVYINAGDSLNFTGATDSQGAPINHTNAGKLSIIDGAGGVLSQAQVNFQSTLTNESTGTVSMRGYSNLTTTGFTNEGFTEVLFAETTLNGPITNNSQINVAFSDLHTTGPFQNNGSLIISSGSQVVFNDDVQNGHATLAPDAEIRIAADSAAVFFGDYSGNGITGAGHAQFEGGLSVGFSPISASFGGDVTLGYNNLTTIELAGTTTGDYDQLLVTNTLTLDGELDLKLYEGYSPAPLHSFTIATFDTLVGDFDTINKPVLNSDLLLIPEITQNEYTFTTAIPGDFNFDGLVNIADLIAWAQGFGAVNTTFQTGDANLDGSINIADLISWAQHFGKTVNDYPASPPSETLTSLSAAISIPEPSALMLMSLSTLTMLRRKKRVA